MGQQGNRTSQGIQKNWKAWEIQSYSAMSETRATFAEREMPSLENIFYRYMDDDGFKYLHKLSQFVTTMNSGKSCSIDLIPNIINNPDFLSILYCRPLREYRKPKFKIANRVRILKYGWPFGKGYQPRLTHEVIETVAFPSRIPPSYILKDEQDNTIRGKIDQKELIKDI